MHLWSLSRSLQQQQPRRHFAAAGGTDFEDAVLAKKAKRKSKSTNKAWDTYLETGTGADAEQVFRAIDLSSNRQISALELKLFVDSVDQKGVSPEGLDLLSKLVAENEADKHHEMDEQEFLQWLNIATNPPPRATEAAAPAATPSSDSPSYSLDGVWKLRAKRKCKLMGTVWKEYLQDPSKETCTQIFKTIDLNRNLKISYLELKLFLDSVDPDNQHISMQAREELDAKASHSAEEDEMDLDHLDAWLSVAVTVSK